MVLTSFMHLISLTVIGILLRHFPLVLANDSNCKHCSNESDDVSLMQCPTSCTCQQAANPFYKFGEKMDSYHDVTAYVMSFCANENQTCLSNDTQFCQQQHSNISLISSIPYIGSLERFQNSGIHAICLSDRNLSCVASNAFETHRFVNVLIMNHNFISNLSWMEGLESISLYYLDISYNRIQTLHRHVFRNTGNLIGLDLSHNRIDSIEANAFSGMKELKLLDLSCNLLCTSTIYDKSFDGLPGLLHLSLANNHDITKLINFYKVGLTNSKLETLDLHGLSNLRSADSFAFSGLATLLTLNLSNCGLRELNVGWLSDGPEERLETLDLSRNYLTSIKTSYFVSLKINKSRQHSMCDAPQIAPCELPYIVSPSMHSTDCNARPLDYQSCLLHSQKVECFQPLPHLSWLSVSENYGLRQIDDNAFKHLPNLRYLFLQNCNISRMRLADDRHQFDDNGINTTLPHLEGVWVSKNPLRCDCHVRLLLEWSNNFGLQNSNCENRSENVNSTHHFVDGAEYFYKDRCQKVISPEIPRCVLGPGQMVPISDVLHSVLSCPEEPVSMFVILLIGPLTFAVSIVLVGICGICAVIITRLKRQQSGFYLTKPNEKRTKTTTVAHHPTKASRGKRISVRFFRPKAKSRANIESKLTPAPSPRLNYKTNIVLDKFAKAQNPGLQSPQMSSISPPPSPRIKLASSNSRTSSLSSRDHRHHHHRWPKKNFLSITNHRKNYTLGHSTTLQETKFMSSPTST